MRVPSSWFVLIAALIVSCCSCAVPDEVAPRSAQTPSPFLADRYGAPVVSPPRDVSGIASSPCSTLLTSRELSDLGFEEPGRERTVIQMRECSWTNGDDEQLAMTVNADRDLLVDTYRTRLLPIFEPTTVEGMPAVRQRMRRDDNTCTVTTGLGPRQALETEWSGLTSRQTTDPCARAEEAIALVIRKLPPQR